MYNFYYFEHFRCRFHFVRQNSQSTNKYPFVCLQMPYVHINRRHCELWMQVDPDSRIDRSIQSIILYIVYGHNVYVYAYMFLCFVRLCIVFEAHRTRGKREKCHTYKQPKNSLSLRRLGFACILKHSFTTKIVFS